VADNTVCDPIWQLSSRSGEAMQIAILRTVTYLHVGTHSSSLAVAQVYLSYSLSLAKMTVKHSEIFLSSVFTR